MIDTKEIVDKKGVGWIITLGLVPIVDIIFCIKILKYAFGKQKLDVVPQWILTENMHLGSSLIWAIVFFVYSIPMSIAFLVAMAQSGYFFIMFLLFGLVPLLIGVGLLMHFTNYQKYLKMCNELLPILAMKKSYRSDEIIIVDGTRKSFEELTEVLDDLSVNSLIDYRYDSETDETLLAVYPDELPELQCEEDMDQNTFSSTTNEVKTITFNWNCPNCGATNTALVKTNAFGVCEYCGTKQNVE